MNLLITGGAGYIGTHTLIELLRDGHSVFVIDNFANSKPGALKNVEKIVGQPIPFEEGDLLDEAFTERVFASHPFDAVIHFAASKAVGESVEQPLMYYENNLTSLMNILTLMREFNVPNLVFSSSCTVYGQAEKLPVSEQTPRREATSPYGNTKHMCEDIIRDSVAAYPEVNAIALRYFNPIGAHPSAEIGELPRGVPNNLIPFVTQTAAGIRPVLSVFGDDYNTPDGSCIRDYIYVVDLAKAHVCAMTRIMEDKTESPVEVYNIGTGKGTSVLELIHGFEKATGVKLNYQIVGRRAGDIEKVWGNVDKANHVRGWKAEPPLEDVLASAWKWQLALRERGIM